MSVNSKTSLLNEFSPKLILDRLWRSMIKIEQTILSMDIVALSKQLNPMWTSDNDSRS